MKRGFTLAEVLITVSVIGVVAALTMPGIYENYQKKVTAERLHRFYKIMSEAVELYKKDHHTDYVDVSDCTDADKCKKWFEDGLGKYLKYTSIDNDTGDAKVAFNRIHLTDGSCFIFARKDTGKSGGWNIDTGATHFIHVKYSVDKAHCYTKDKNFKRPQAGKHLFLFSIDEDGNFVTDYPLLFCPKGNASGNRCTINHAINRGDVFDTCSKYSKASNSQPHGCASLIEMDGWKISDDYPAW